MIPLSKWELIEYVSGGAEDAIAAGIVTAEHEGHTYVATGIFVKGEIDSVDGIEMEPEYDMMDELIEGFSKSIRPQKCTGNFGKSGPECNKCDRWGMNCPGTGEFI